MVLLALALESQLCALCVPGEILAQWEVLHLKVESNREKTLHVLLWPLRARTKVHTQHIDNTHIVS